MWYLQLSGTLDSVYLISSLSLSLSLSLSPVGTLHQVRMDDKLLKSPARSSGKVRSQLRHCFLFSKHLLITTRVQKKPQDQYRMIKVKEVKGAREGGEGGREGNL